jgi:O-antigen/teichoic acid export membrane protein
MKEKIAIRFVIQSLIQLSSAISSYFILRNLEVSLFGIQGSVLTTISFFSVVFYIGIDIVYLQYSDDEHFDDMFSSFFLIKTGLAFLNFVPLIIYMLIGNFAYTDYFIIMIIATLFLRYGDLFCLHLRSKLKIIKGEIVEFASGFGLSLFRLIFAFNINSFENPLLVLGLITFFFYFLKLVLSLFMARKDFRFSKPNFTHTKNLIKATLPLTFSTMIIILTDNIGNFIINLSYSSEEFAYYYAINSYIIVLLTGLSLSVASIYQIYYTKWLNRNENDKIENFTFMIEKYSTILYLLIIIGVFIVGELFLQVLLPNYLPGLRYLYILCFLPLLSGVNRPYVKLLYAARKQKLLAKYYIFSRLGYLLVVLALIPPSIGNVSLFGLGAIGMSFLQIGINAIDYVFYRKFCKTHLNVKYNWDFIKILILGLIPILFHQLVLKHLISFDSSPWIGVVINFIIASGIFLGVLVLSKRITLKDYKLVKQLVNIKNYKASLNEEFQDKEKK